MAQHRGLVLLLAGVFVMLTLWSFALPVFQGDDESAHWQYAAYLHDRHVLPLYGSGFVEANEPPLYYALVAPVAMPSDAPPLIIFSGAVGGSVIPFAPKYYATGSSDLTKYWPFRLARLETALISLVTVLFAYLAGREVTGRVSTGILTAGIVGFLPEFSYRGMNVSCDAMVATMGAIELYLIVRIVRRGFTWRIGLAASLGLAGAFLSKDTAICLAPALALALFWTCGPTTTRLTRCVALLGLSLLIALPWLLRNQILYGDPLASRAMLTAVPGLIQKKSVTSPYFVTMFPNNLARSFVAVFSYMQIWMNEWVYRAFAACGIAALGGLALRVWRDRSQLKLVTILGSIVLCNVLVVVDINLVVSQALGRYMFPALPAVALLVALGLEAIPGWMRMPSRLSAVAVVGLAALNAAILWIVIIPAFWTGGPYTQPTRVLAAAAPLPDTTRSLRSSIDHINATVTAVAHPAAPVVAAGSLLTVDGWAVDTARRSTVGAVFLVVDGRLTFPTYYGAPRPDVASSLHSAAYLRSGFVTTVPTSSLGAGSHTLQLRVMPQGLHTYFTAPRAVHFVVR